MKKALSLVLAVMMLVGMIIPASAEVAGDPVTFSISTVEGLVGDTITVDVMVSENHYIVNGHLVITYDPAAIELVKLYPDDPDLPYFDSVNTKIIKANAMWAFEVPEEGRANFAFASPSDIGPTVGGTIFTLTFKILDGAKTKNVIELDVVEMCSNNTTEGDDPDTMENEDPDYDTNVTVVNGMVNVADGIEVAQKGDVDLSGVVSITDAVLLFQYVNGTANLNEVQLANGELTDDGAITITDAVALFQYINGTAEL